jgi:hypothetical protein
MMRTGKIGRAAMTNDVVEWAYQKARAENAIASLRTPGITQVKNHICVGP